MASTKLSTESGSGLCMCVSSLKGCRLESVLQMDWGRLGHRRLGLLTADACAVPLVRLCVPFNNGRRGIFNVFLALYTLKIKFALPLAIAI